MVRRRTCMARTTSTTIIIAAVFTFRRMVAFTKSCWLRECCEMMWRIEKVACGKNMNDVDRAGLIAGVYPALPMLSIIYEGDALTCCFSHALRSMDDCAPSSTASSASSPLLLVGYWLVQLGSFKADVAPRLSQGRSMRPNACINLSLQLYRCVA
jgi:hypothetical protein